MFLWLRKFLLAWRQPPGTREADMRRALRELQRFRQVLTVAQEELRLSIQLTDVTEQQMSNAVERESQRAQLIRPESFDASHRQRGASSG